MTLAERAKVIRSTGPEAERGDLLKYPLYRRGALMALEFLEADAEFKLPEELEAVARDLEAAPDLHFLDDSHGAWARRLRDIHDVLEPRLVTPPAVEMELTGLLAEIDRIQAAMRRRAPAPPSAWGAGILAGELRDIVEGVVNRNLALQDQVEQLSGERDVLLAERGKVDLCLICAHPADEHPLSGQGRYCRHDQCICPRLETRP